MYKLSVNNMKNPLLLIVLLVGFIASCKKHNCDMHTPNVIYPYTKSYQGHFTYWQVYESISTMNMPDTITGDADTTAAITFLSPDSCTVTWIWGRLSGSPSSFAGVGAGILNAHYTTTGFCLHSLYGHIGWELQLHGDSLIQITNDTANGIDSWARSHHIFAGRALQ